MLLKNSGILPLDPKKVHSVALVGSQADRFENGNGTDDVDPPTYTTVRDAITTRAGSRTPTVVAERVQSAAADQGHDLYRFVSNRWPSIASAGGFSLACWIC